jgi:hypothetical protein
MAKHYSNGKWMSTVAQGMTEFTKVAIGLGVRWIRVIPFQFCWCLVEKVKNGVVLQKAIFLQNPELSSSKNNTRLEPSFPLPTRRAPFVSPCMSHPQGVFLLPWPLSMISRSCRRPEGSRQPLPPRSGRPVHSRKLRSAPTLGAQSATGPSAHRAPILVARRPCHSHPTGAARRRPWGPAR